MTKLPGEHITPDAEAAFGPVWAEHQVAYDWAKSRVKGKKVLDLGSGSGYASALFARVAAEVVAVDQDRAAIALAQREHKADNLTFQVVKIDDLPFGDSSFETVVLLQVIEHIPNYRKLLREIGRVLSDGGELLMTTPNTAMLGYNENPYHCHEFTGEELAGVIHEVFDEVQMLGVYGDEKVMRYEKNRREGIERVFRFDPLRIRRLLPRFVRIFGFNLGALITRRRLTDVTTKGSNIVVTDFSIRPETHGSLDLMAICRRQKR